jgi:hypothetical protein
MVGNGQFLALKALNSFSPRLFSFTVFIEREGFINLFFEFLDSSGRSVKIL